MVQGMLWFDNNQVTSLTEKLSRARAYYETKYGKAPDFCLVNNKIDISQAGDIPGMIVETHKLILLNHFLLGVNNGQEKLTAEKE